MTKWLKIIFNFHLFSAFLTYRGGKLPVYIYFLRTETCHFILRIIMRLITLRLSVGQ